MNIEQLAILGIVIFGFIALMQAFSTVRSIKKVNRKATDRLSSTRYRRPVGSGVSARLIADGLVREIMEKHKALAEEAADTGIIPESLDEILRETHAYYRERVESRHRALFHTAVNELVLNKKEPSS